MEKAGYTCGLCGEDLGPVDAEKRGQFFCSRDHAKLFRQVLGNERYQFFVLMMKAVLTRSLKPERHTHLGDAIHASQFPHEAHAAFRNAQRMNPPAGFTQCVSPSLEGRFVSGFVQWHFLGRLDRNEVGFVPLHWADFERLHSGASKGTRNNRE